MTLKPPLGVAAAGNPARALPQRALQQEHTAGQPAGRSTAQKQAVAAALQTSDSHPALHLDDATESEQHPVQWYAVTRLVPAAAAGSPKRAAARRRAGRAVAPHKQHQSKVSQNYQ